MKQITEDYVSYEIAKLLKEKGFDSNMYTCYTDCEFPEFLTMIDYVVQGEEYERSNFESHNLIQAPTHQMALKWLREVHNIHIDVFIGSDESCDMDGVTIDEWHFWTYYITNTSGDMIYDAYNKVDVIEHQTYEEAVEASLKYTLENLI